MSALTHLCRSVMGRDYAGRIISAMSAFTCYWDDSGNDPGTGTVSKSDSEFLCVAGYLAHIDDWANAEDRWRAVLLEYDDINLPRTGFHMVAFANRRRPYSSLSDARYDSLIASLLDIIGQWPRMRVSWSLRADDYMNVIKARHLLDTEIVRAFHILSRRCIALISDIARAADYREKILHVFDQGNSSWPTLEPTFTAEMLDGLNIYRPITQSKKDILAIQAADILAHQVGRYHMLESHPEIKNQRIYTDRLFKKPGVARSMGSRELLDAYQEELALEKARSERRPITRSFSVPPSAYHQELAREMFRVDGRFPFGGILRNLQ